MKIIHVLITSVLILFFTYLIYGFVTFDITLQELKKTIGARNEAQATNIITDLDKFIEKRISDFGDLSKISEIQSALKESNKEFSEFENLENIINIRESEIEFNSDVPFIAGVLNEELSNDLKESINFYKDEYNYDVVEELFVTNQHGANVAFGIGTSDYRQDDEEWWQASKNNGLYIGELEYKENYQNFVLELGFGITDDENNFIGVMRVLVSMDDLLHQFVDDAEILQAVKKDVILLDEQGKIIYSKEIVYDFNSLPVNYFDLLTKEKGFLDLGIETESKLVSYGKSIGYKNFPGFGWTAIVFQDKSAVIEEFVELRDKIFATLIIGVIISVIVGIVSSVSITKPLRQMSIATKKLSKGDFDVKVKPSKIDEIQSIGNAINNMGSSLRKLVETEKKLAEANVKVKSERLTAMGELAASMAHDMKNPLGTIRTAAEIVKRNAKGDDEEMKKVLARMDRAIYRMSHQIEDVLNFVRITPLNFKKVSLKKLFNTVIESLEIPKNITVNLPDSDVQVTCDERKIEIVFINLILNAIQAIGESQGSISIRILAKDEYITVEIQDSGSGIPDDLLETIFKPLVTTKQKGTGLGLSTCTNIIEQHGGTISARNNPTTFFVELPNNLQLKINE